MKWTFLLSRYGGLILQGCVHILPHMNLDDMRLAWQLLQRTPVPVP